MPMTKTELDCHPHKWAIDGDVEPPLQKGRSSLTKVTAIPLKGQDLPS